MPFGYFDLDYFAVPKFDVNRLSRAELTELLAEVMFRLRQFEGEDAVKSSSNAMTTSQKLRLGESAREFLRKNSN